MTDKLVTVITGASAGIGAALGRVFARHGHALVLVARREDKLKALAVELEKLGAPFAFVLPLDLMQNGAADRIARTLIVRGWEAQYLVNNAGFGLFGDADALDREEQLRMIDLNIRTLTDLSLTFVDALARHRGGLLNVASVASFLPGPGMAVYYASKAYVLSFSEALHRELAPKGVRVTALCPGPVPTGFQSRAGYKTSADGDATSSLVEQVAEAGFRGLMRGKRCVVPGRSNKLLPFALRFFPRGMVLAASHARQKRRRSAKPPSL